MLRVAVRISFWFVLTCAMLGITIWGTMALWYRLPFDDMPRVLVCALFGVSGVVTLLAFFRQRRVLVLAPFTFAFALLVGWWSTLQPPAEANWSPDVARQVTGRIDGDILTLTDVRNFRWTDDGEVIERWETHTYDLSELATTDLFLSYWGGPAMAHFVLSFGFTDGRYMAWSIEVRRQLDGGFSPVADMFKANPLVVVAATEADVIGVRTNIRQEDVQLFRLRTDPKASRKLLEEYVRDANKLAEDPEWYNSITTNCTTVVLKMLRAIGDGPPLNWRIIVNGYLPEFDYERGSLNTNYSIEQLRELGSVSPKGRAFGLAPGYSDAIRVGVPTP